MRAILDDVERWQADGHHVALARVVSLRGPGPCEVGATLAVNDIGEVAGSFSAGCVEGVVVATAMEALVLGRPQLCTFSYSDDEALSIGLACGGALDVFVEPLE